MILFIYLRVNPVYLRRWTVLESLSRATLKSFTRRWTCTIGVTRIKNTTFWDKN